MHTLYTIFAEDGPFTLLARRAVDLWRDNIGLQFDNRFAFIYYVLNHLTQMPEQYVEIKCVNIGLTQLGEHTAIELELGKNICALSDAYGI
jgi:hypothetical protein